MGGCILIGSAPLTQGSTSIGEYAIGGMAIVLAVIGVIYEVIMIALLWMKEPNHLIRLLIVSNNFFCCTLCYMLAIVAMYHLNL